MDFFITLILKRLYVDLPLSLIVTFITYPHGSFSVFSLGKQLFFVVSDFCCGVLEDESGWNASLEWRSPPRGEDQERKFW